MLRDLNKPQLEAATTLEGPLLILAGAGSGKTKTMISRAANIARITGRPDRILCLTFTTKAAKEMSERGVAMLNKHQPD